MIVNLLMLAAGLCMAIHVHRRERHLSGPVTGRARAVVDDPVVDSACAPGPDRSGTKVVAP